MPILSQKETQTPFMTCTDGSKNTGCNLNRAVYHRGQPKLWLLFEFDQQENKLQDQIFVLNVYIFGVYFSPEYSVKFIHFKSYGIAGHDFS